MGAGAALLGYSTHRPIADPPPPQHPQDPHPAGPPPKDPHPWVRRAMGAHLGAGRVALLRPRCSAQLVIVTFGISRFHLAQ